MAGISSKAAGGIENKKRYNGNELQNDEFSDGSGLEFYDFNARTYDQQMGRFHQIDPLTDAQENLTPYHFSFNDPIRYSDPDGKFPFPPGILSWAAQKVAQNPNSGTSKAIGVGVGVASFITKTVSAPIELIKNPPNLSPAGLGETAIGLAVNIGERVDKIQNGNGFDKAAAITETVLDGAALVAGGRAMGTALKTEVAAGESVTLYRGVNENHVAYGEASQGNVVPRGGSASAAEHNAGNTKSPFTSWTTNPEVATNYALRPKGGGVVLEVTVPKSSTVASPSLKNVNLKQSPGTVVNEFEVLLRNPIKAATMRQVQ